MIHVPIVCDVDNRVVSENCDWTESHASKVDISAVLLEAFGDDPDGEAVLGFIAEPWECSFITTVLQDHPEVSCPIPELASDFNLAGALQPGLDSTSPDGEIVAAWIAWRDAAKASGSQMAHEMRKWEVRTSTLRQDIEASTLGSEPMVCFATELLRSDAMVEALIEAASRWEGDPMRGLRLNKALAEIAETVG